MQTDRQSRPTGDGTHFRMFYFTCYHVNIDVQENLGLVKKKFSGQRKKFVHFHVFLVIQN